jgi:L-alanine-DL-glutamate epimerase-like enolase superfamily enzyme
MVHDVLDPPLELLPGGEFRPPAGPGWGYAVDAAKIGRYAVQRWPL